MNAVSQILQFSKRRPHAMALIEGQRHLTYGALGELVRRTAQHLLNGGLQPSERIGLCLKDSIDHIVALLAAAWMGAVAVPLDWRAKPNECARLIKELGITCTLIEPGTAPAGGVPGWPVDAQWHSAVAQAVISAALLEDGLSTGWDNVFLISATSGSTGAPKFTQMTHLQYHFALAGMYEIMGLSGRHHFLCTSPLYYSGGRNSCLAHLMRGDCVVLYPSLVSAREYTALVQRYEITVAVLVPTMIRQLLAIAGDTPLLPELAALFCSGAPLYAEEKRAALQRLTPRFQERYGTSETLAVAVLRPEDFAERITSVGQPHSLIAAEVVDPHDQPLPAGTSGRLRLRGPGMGTPVPGRAGPSQFKDGWFYPGELAAIDSEGYIFLQGRTSDVMIRNGAKIFPAEVEAVLASHPAVAEAAVFGQRGADAEDIILAFAVARHAVPPGELLAHCRARLTPHKVPRQIILVDELPKNTAGKIDKHALSALADQRCANPA